MVDIRSPGPRSAHKSTPPDGGAAGSGESGSAGERTIQVVAAISLIFSIIYIAWRWGWTLNRDALWFSIPLALAETYGLITALLLTVTAWSLKQRTPLPAPKGKTVDVYVTVYDEPLAVIRKTALSAREIRYPHHTYILDDGKRDEVRALAEELDIEYLRREDNKHAKAGNLNHALSQTSGDFILQLDADHVPLPQIIDRLLGFMTDENVAFAQSPQDFYNTDGFTYDVNQRARRIWEDQQLFFRVLQPGKDRMGAAFFVGSCALLRRRALDEIGGFATGSITEDIETSLLLHSRGWRSVYLNETLAYGLAPASATAFHIQHLRWGQGAMQVLRKHRPLTMHGLTLGQRLAYFDSLSTYLGGFQRLILYLAPIAFFVTGAFPLQTTPLIFAVMFLPYIVMQLVSFKLLARGHGSLQLADRYSMAKFFTHMLTISGLSRKPIRFRVTPKGASDVPFSTYAPQVVLIGLTVIAIGYAVIRELGADPYEVAGWGMSAFWVNLVFALWNVGVAGFIVRMSLRIKQKRADHRFSEALPVNVRVMRADGKLSALDIAVSENLNPHGVALRSMHPLDNDTRVEVRLPLSTREVVARGRVVHRRDASTDYGAVYVHGIEFEGLDWDARDAIELHCSQHSMPIERQRYDEGGGTLAQTVRRWRGGRRERRIEVGMPAQVTMFNDAGDERDIGVALLEDVSPNGARILLDHPVAPNSQLRLKIPSAGVITEGTTVFVHALETSVGMRFMVGIRTLDTVTAGAATNPWLIYVFGAAGRAGQTLAAGYRAVALQTGRSITAGYQFTAASVQATRRLLTPAAKPTAVKAPSVIDTVVPAATVAPAPQEMPVRATELDTALPPVAPPVAPPVEEPALWTPPAPWSPPAAPLDEVPAEPEPVYTLPEPQAEPKLPAFSEFVPEPSEPVVTNVFASAVRFLAASPTDEPSPVPTASSDERAATESPIVTGEKIMTSVPVAPGFAPHAARPGEPNLLGIRGKKARLQGTIEVEESIDIQCEMSGDIICGGKVTIGEEGDVNADVRTVEAVIRGRFNGHLIASGTVSIAVTGRVYGTIETPELEIAKGAIFKGIIERPDDNEEPPKAPSGPIVTRAAATPAAPASTTSPTAASGPPTASAQTSATPQAAAAEPARPGNGTTGVIQEVVVLSADSFAPTAVITP